MARANTSVPWFIALLVFLLATILVLWGLNLLESIFLAPFN